MARWRCECGHPLEPVLPAFDPDGVESSDRSVWRYAAMLGGRPAIAPTLGEGGTPLVAGHVQGRPVLAKLEYLQPTGCHKDRGSAVVAASLRAAGVEAAVEDSSGNAGASLAAYAARTGIELSLFVPAGTPAAKLRQAAAHGARVDRSAVDREAAARLAEAAAGPRRPYASHVFCPFFLAGQATLAFELWEDLDDRPPDNVIVPVGNGILILGLFLGFAAVRAASGGGRGPRLFGVQARACAPIAEAFAAGADAPVEVTARNTKAVGVRVARPARGPEVLAAVRASRGALVSVGERAIARAGAEAAGAGWFVEPSAAVALAGLAVLATRLPPSERTVVVLTGSGLKR